MKLLLDQNLSPRLVGLIVGAYPGSMHVREFGMQRASDEVIWEFARTSDFTIVSKDVDFQHKSFVRGFPPKVIWLRVGNRSTRYIADRLLAHAGDVHGFVVDPDASFLTIS